MCYISCDLELSRLTANLGVVVRLLAVCTVVLYYDVLQKLQEHLTLFQCRRNVQCSFSIFLAVGSCLLFLILLFFFFNGLGLALFGLGY